MCGNIGPRGMSGKILELMVCDGALGNIGFSTPCGKNCDFVIDDECGLIQKKG